MFKNANVCYDGYVKNSSRSSCRHGARWNPSIGEYVEGDGDITAGSTVVTLKADYLNALALGVHTLKFVYNDGEVATNFTIVDPRVEESPFTADESGMFKIMFVISLVGLSFGWLRLKSLAKDEQAE